MVPSGDVVISLEVIESIDSFPDTTVSLVLSVAMLFVLPRQQIRMCYCKGVIDFNIFEVWLGRGLHM